MTDPNPEAHAPLTCEGDVVGLSASPDTASQGAS